MRHKKRKLDEKNTVRFFMRTALLCLAIWYAIMVSSREYRERKKCVCSVLTSEEQTLKIDERLEQVYRIEDLSLGTFVVVSTQCDHGYKLRLKIDRAFGTYQGRIVN